MSYLILALGGLLSLGGALALHASYGIVQIERGWAGVIAGSTALSCGIVTIALGLILHQLSGFYAHLRAGASAAPLPRGVEEHEASRPQEDQTPSSAPDGAFVPEAQRQARSNLSSGRTILNARGPAVQAATRAREPDYEVPRAPVIPPPGSRSDGAAVDQVAEPGHGFVIAAKSTDETGHSLESRSSFIPVDEMPAAAAPNASGEPRQSQDGVRREPPVEAAFPEMPISPRESDLQAGQYTGWPAETASLESILPEDFRLAPDVIPEASTEAAEEPFPEVFATEDTNPAQPAAAGSGAVAQLRESASGEDPPAIPVIQGDTLAIVGRYESEGTSYVMYADGSIEARTEHAVFHFKSMAELKSFMDSQAQNSSS